MLLDNKIFILYTNEPVFSCALQYGRNIVYLYDLYIYSIMYNRKEKF